MSDFEILLVQSLELQFRGYFQFSQCLWRKLQSLGQVEGYKEDGFVRQFIQKSAVIPFVPFNFVCVAWDELKAENKR